MGGLKRKEAEWGFEELFKEQPAGSEMRPIQLDADTILLHFTCPSTWTSEQMEAMGKWGRRLKKQLPENAFVLLTSEEIKINLTRPPPVPVFSEINIVVDQTTINTTRKLWEELTDKIKMINLAATPVNVNLRVQSCNIAFEEEEENV